MVISSMNCILHCLFGLNNIDMVKNIVINKSKEKEDFTNFPFLFFKFFDKIQEKRNNTINNDNYNNSLKNFINHFQQKCSSIENAKPTNIFSNILFLFQKEFCPLIFFS